MFITAPNYSINPAATAAPIGNSFGSLVAADQLCNARGQAPYLLATFGSLTFKALLSDASTNARDRVSIAGRVINATGQVLANDFNDLWDGTIATGVRYTEFGTASLDNTVFWTGSNQFGIASQTANSWQQTATQNVNFGLSQATSNWFNQGTVAANQSYRLVAISEARVINPGDFNDDGKVDAADYVMWRRTVGSTVSRGYFADGDGDGTIGDGDYNVWRAKFGTTYAAGSGASVLSTAVPEPTTIVLLLVSLVAFPARRCKPSGFVGLEKGSELFVD